MLDNDVFRKSFSPTQKTVLINSSPSFSNFSLLFVAYVSISLTIYDLSISFSSTRD